MISIALEDLRLVSGGDKQNLSINIPAGPIWDNDHAQVICPIAVQRYSTDYEWNGQWTTTEWNVMSVCGGQPIQNLK